jgi:hypothetical protein
MRFIAVLLLLFVSTAAQSQLATCPALSIATPQPWNEARVTWTAPTTYENGQPLGSGVVLRYTVLRRTGTTGTFTAICETTATSTSLSNQPLGQNFYTATARTNTSAQSAQATPDDKIITEPAPSQPTNITVASTRIEQYEWTCRDDAGAVLTTHTRQDKAQESCTNLALANLGKSFEMRPSGYRIAASAR